MSLSALAMRYRPVVLTLVGLMTAWGVVTFLTMPRREDPEFTIRTCVVQTRWPGTPTVKVEELITDKLEETLDSIEEVDYLNSETINGQSTIFVNLEDRVPVDAIQNVWDKVRAKVELVPMPAPGVRPIVNDEFGDTTILLLGIYQTPLEENQPEDANTSQVMADEQTPDHGIAPEHRYSPRRLEIYADQVRDAVRLLNGVAKVEKYGVQDEAIYIETDLGTWSQVGLTTGALRQATWVGIARPVSRVAATGQIHIGATEHHNPILIGQQIPLAQNHPLPRQPHNMPGHRFTAKPQLISQLLLGGHRRGADGG